MQGNERWYIYALNTADGNHQVFLADTYTVWTYGFGALVGFRQPIWCSLFVEPLIGIAFGGSSMEPLRPNPMNSPDDGRMFNLARVELAIRYGF